jgi:hypothetical protein
MNTNENRCDGQHSNDKTHDHEDEVHVEYSAYFAVLVCLVKVLSIRAEVDVVSN